MFDFLKKKKRKQNKELDAAIRKILMNMENNYKDAAQINLREFEELLCQLEQGGRLTEEQKLYYREQLTEFQNRLKNFTHKDQKPYWV